MEELSRTSIAPPKFAWPNGESCGNKQIVVCQVGEHQHQLAHGNMGMGHLWLNGWGIYHLNGWVDSLNG